MDNHGLCGSIRSGSGIRSAALCTVAIVPLICGVLTLFAFLHFHTTRGMSGKDLLHWAGEVLLVIGVSLAAWGISEVRRERTQLPSWRGILGRHLRTARLRAVQRLWRSGRGPLTFAHANI